jgi:Protein of unknown function (DUF3892)
MADRQVTCVERVTVRGLDEHGGITHLGGDGWHLTRGEVIAAIESREHSFYTLEDGKRAEVRVRRSGIAPYPNFVRTQADEHWTNNLLELPHCAASRQSPREAVAQPAVGAPLDEETVRNQH